MQQEVEAFKAQPSSTPETKVTVIVPNAPPVETVSAPIPAVSANGNGAHHEAPVPFKRAPIIPPTVTTAAPPPPPPKEEVVAEIPLFEDDENAALPAGHKEVLAVFFYPKDAEKNLENVFKKFQDVIKKHKLKFRLKRVHSHAYECKAKINYTMFVDVCREKKSPVAIVIGPPPEAPLPENDFYDLLSVTLDVQGVSLQLISWAEIDKDYRYLNLALDIALVRTK
jgi:hypothetical protein